MYLICLYFNVCWKLIGDDFGGNSAVKHSTFSCSYQIFSQKAISISNWTTFTKGCCFTWFKNLALSRWGLSLTNAINLNLSLSDIRPFGKVPQSRAAVRPLLLFLITRFAISFPFLLCHSCLVLLMSPSLSPYFSHFLGEQMLWATPVPMSSKYPSMNYSPQYVPSRVTSNQPAPPAWPSSYNIGKFFQWNGTSTKCR